MPITPLPTIEFIQLNDACGNDDNLSDFCGSFYGKKINLFELFCKFGCILLLKLYITNSFGYHNKARNSKVNR